MRGEKWVFSGRSSPCLLLGRPESKGTLVVWHQFLLSTDHLCHHLEEISARLPICYELTLGRREVSVC
jgi:hypothetical protein